ncbi:hypothetical protein L2D14_04010 [Thalassospiraceae bacterium LMO-JJ14]|nr:hypothetical protein L2D14_04010 [Thalassospiraceae bacterium LMO-JJ14]
MRKSSKMTAEEQFKATQKKAEKVLEEKELAEEARAQQISTLRARRLLKVAADKKAAEAAAPKPRKRKTTS